MNKKHPVSSYTSMEDLKKPSDSRLLLISSEEAGWKELTVRAYQEKLEEHEGWIEPTVPDTTLFIFTRGAASVERRYANSHWRKQHIQQGELYLTPGGSPPTELRWRNLSPEPVQTLRLLLSTALLSRTAQEIADRDYTRLAHIQHSGFHDPVLMQIGLALWQELEQLSPAGNLYAQTASQMIAVHLLRHYHSVGKTLKDPSQGLTHQQICRVMDFVQAHLSQDLSLETLAQQVGFSPYHFARLFRQTTGESPHQFVLRQRIERAQQLLEKTDMPLSLIASESGFADQSHLTQAFKRQQGLTPRAYRLDRLIKASFS
ncbi:AraC family transcriptional regulator [Ktedonosporobacter rubrisoli]|uniref:AraC family transcriptional regulator n=1 Tax=Ktedonosporobacter rubrisoli TaxID=2509675 RepID=UPI0013EE7E77|nr:AraC family transcriptional regulator [Ktedonosporobacter rubrisoli]